jgi:hypothetical protein
MIPMRARLVDRAANVFLPPRPKVNCPAEGFTTTGPGPFVHLHKGLPGPLLVSLYQR